MCNSLASLCYSKIIQPRYLITQDVNKVLTFGNSEYSRLGFVNDYLSFDDIQSTFNLGDHTFELQKSERYSGYLTNESKDFIQFIPPFTRGVFIANGLSTCFIFQSGSIYIFDPHSRSENGLVSPNGTAVLLKFSSLSKAQDYIKFFFLDQFDHCSATIGYEYQLFNIDPSQTAINSIKTSRRLEYKSGKRKYSFDQSNERVAKYRMNLSKEKLAKEISNARKEMSELRTQETPEKKANNRLNARKQMSELRKQATPEKKSIKLFKAKERMSNFRARVLTFEDSKIKEIGLSNRIKTFKKQIVKGPFYICVICNRTLYKTSVLLFLETKYEITSNVIFSSRVQSFDSLEYICRTCYSKLLKNNTPAQAVCNDLRICNVPDRFSDNRKLEKIIISRRILFKNVTIISKGQAPKMKGAICNVPINAADICNVLPRGMDNNGIVRVALKKKMCFKSNVYFQPVRPNFVNEILLYLENANHLYSDIEIQINSIPPFWINTINNNDGDNDDEQETEDFEVSKGFTENKIQTHLKSKLQTNILEEEDPNPLDDFRVSASETAFVPELSYEVVHDSNITIAPGENREPLPVICDDECEMLAHPFLFPTGKFGYTHTRDIKLSPCKYFWGNR